MTYSESIALLEELTALQVQSNDQERLDSYRLGYYKAWLAHVISSTPAQQQILKDLISYKKEAQNVG
jgi:hypothetical protein